MMEMMVMLAVTVFRSATQKRERYYIIETWNIIISNNNDDNETRAVKRA